MFFNSYTGFKKKKKNAGEVLNLSFSASQQIIKGHAPVAVHNKTHKIAFQST